MAENRFYDASVNRYISEDEARAKGFDAGRKLDDGNARIRHDNEVRHSRRLPENLPEEYTSVDYQFGG